MLIVSTEQRQESKPSVIFRTDAEMKQMLEDIATASGYGTLQDFMLDVAAGVIDHADTKVMETVRDIQKRRAQRIPPTVQAPGGTASKKSAPEPVPKKAGRGN